MRAWRSELFGESELGNQNCRSVKCVSQAKCKTYPILIKFEVTYQGMMNIWLRSSERWCTTVVDAVKWDASLLPTDDKGEPLIAFAPVGLIDGLDTDSPNFYVFVGLFALVAVCLCAAFAVLAHHISAKGKETKEDLVTRPLVLGWSGAAGVSFFHFLQDVAKSF